MVAKNEEPCILVKTMLDMEHIVATRIKEALEHVSVEACPGGYKGLVIVYNCRDRDSEAGVIMDRVVEADRVIPIMAVSPADPEKIASIASDLARELIKKNECFAVRTVRRGRHNFTSVDVNVIVGDKVREVTGACVNLTRPDKIVLVEIIKDKAFISIMPGSIELKKLPPGKKPIHRLMRKIRAVQMPYLGPLEACRKMGVRIGREVQNFEISELIIAPAGKTPARELAEFLIGVEEGVDSRYRIQLKTYNNRRARRVRVFVEDLHQFVREHGSNSDEAIIVLEPEGAPISESKEKILELFKKYKKINILAGSREGIPLGVYRFADIVVDIAPGITLSTEYALSSAIIAIISIIYNDLGEDLEDVDDE